MGDRSKFPNIHLIPTPKQWLNAGRSSECTILTIIYGAPTVRCSLLRLGQIMTMCGYVQIPLEFIRVKYMWWNVQICILLCSQPKTIFPQKMELQNVRKKYIHKIYVVLTALWPFDFNANW